MQELKEVEGLKEIVVNRWASGLIHEEKDVVAFEEPFEMRIGFGPSEQRSKQPLSITMRTPGEDKDLFVGFLFTEGIVKRAEDILSVKKAGNTLMPQDNVMIAELSPDLDFDPSHLSRNFYTTSSCGVCGKTSIDLVETVSNFTTHDVQPIIEAETMAGLPNKLSGAQSLFERTGGIHAAGLFGTDGELLLLREDVGRHNALDKLIGTALSTGMLPLDNHVLLLSGRISFELVQKAAMAGISVIGAVGAPSSLAIELAEKRGITLAGFLRPKRFNIYSNQARITAKKEVLNEA